MSSPLALSAKAGVPPASLPRRLSGANVRTDAARA
jgi:hypothetical protein